MLREQHLRRPGGHSHQRQYWRIMILGKNLSWPVMHLHMGLVQSSRIIRRRNTAQTNCFRKLHIGTSRKELFTVAERRPSAGVWSEEIPPVSLWQTIHCHIRPQATGRHLPQFSAVVIHGLFAQVSNITLISALDRPRTSSVPTPFHPNDLRHSCSFIIRDPPHSIASTAATLKILPSYNGVDNILNQKAAHLTLANQATGIASAYISNDALG